MPTTESNSQQKSADDLEPHSDVSSSRRLTDEQMIANRIAQRTLATWSRLGVDVGPFVKNTLTLVPRTQPIDEALDAIMIEDLFLAHACGLGNQPALNVFDQRCMTELSALANKFRISASDVDDIRQSLWNKLFVGSDQSKPKILEYRGSGPLRHWFRVLAARTILEELRRSKRRDNIEAEAGNKILSDSVPSSDPELDNIRLLYRDTFRAAFEKAAAALQPEERNLLRCAYIMGMSTDEIAKAFGTHKATAARHVAKAREKLHRLTREELRDHLGANSGELDSVIRLFDGELSVSLSRMLK